MLEILGQVLFWLVMILAIFVIPFGLPGTFVIVGAALVYGLLTDFAAFSWKFVLVLLLISVVAEIVEFFLGAATAGKYGGSRPAMIGAIVGGFLGAIWGTPVLPPLGILLGAFVGAFLGAAALEYLTTRDVQRSVRVGYGAFLGSVGGRLTKIAAAIAMVVMVGFKVF